MSTKEQLPVAHAGHSPVAFSQRYEKAFAASAFAFDGGLETN
jgi:hypothetical protein